MTEIENSKQFDLEERTSRFWSFGFRYCLVFSASARDELSRADLEFGSLTAIGYLQPSIRYELRGICHLQVIRHGSLFEDP